MLVSWYLRPSGGKKKMRADIHRGKAKSLCKATHCEVTVFVMVAQSISRQERSKREELFIKVMSKLYITAHGLGVCMHIFLVSYGLY